LLDEPEASFDNLFIKDYGIIAAAISTLVAYIVALPAPIAVTRPVVAST
jgi:hypothetical protein